MRYLLRKLKDLQPGDHLCLIYETEEEHRAVLTPFLRQGLELVDKVIYIVDARTGETVLGYLRGDGVDADAYVQRGQLVILEVDDAYMREGVFNPDGMIRLLRSETDKALAEGYSALRASGEMSWALKGLPGSERLIEYEAKLNAFLPGSQCLAICQYDRRRFTPDILMEVLATHPIAVIGVEVIDNIYYLPPEDLLGPDPDSARLTNCVRNLQDRKRIEEAWQSRAIKLDERLHCLYRIADLVGTPGIALSALLRRVVDLIPPAWYYPEVTCASISLGGEAFTTKNFRETPWKLVSAIKVEDREVGMLQVHYLEERPQADEGPFQGEERQLIDAIAERLGRIIERRRAEQGLGVRNRIADIFLTVPDDEMYGEVLQVVLEVMDSAYGIFGYLDEDGTMACLSMTRDVREKCQVPDKTIRFSRETWGDSLWGRALSEKSSLYANEPGRVPEGHIPIRRVLVVPILFQGEVIGQIVMANKSRDYDVQDQEKLEVIAEYIAPVLHARLQRDREDQARRRAEAAVAVERQRLFSLLETMPAYVGLLTPDYHVAFANRYFKERFGEPGGRRCYEYLFGRSDPCENCQAYKVLETKTPQKYEWLGPDGRTYQIYDQLMHDTDGSPLILEMGIDITDRKLAERSLAEQFSFLQLLIDTIPSPIFYKDVNGVYLGCNQNLAEFLGRPKEAIIGKTVFNVYPKEQAEKYFQMDQELFQHPGTQIYEFVMERSDGAIRNFIFSKATFVDFFGKVAGLIGVMTDITERKLAEEALRKTNETLRATLDAAPVAIFDLDTEGRVKSLWNAAAEEMLGWRRDEVLGHFLPSVPEDSKDEFAGLREWVRSGKTIKGKDVVRRRKDGSLIEYSIYADPEYDDDGKVTGNIAALVDITERRLAEQKLGRVTRALKTLSLCNEALVRAVEETALLQDICRIIVEVGGYRMAWVGYARQDEGKSVEPIAHKGFEKGYMQTLMVTWADTERGRGPAGIAIRTGKPSFTRDIQSDPRFAPWREEALKRGFASVLALPLKDTEAFGVLAIYASEPNAFDEDESKLLEELASDISFGIKALRTSAARQQAEAQLRESLERVRKTMVEVVQAMALTVEIRDPYTGGHQRRVTQLALAIAQELGLDENRIEGLRVAGFLHDIGKIAVPAEILSKPGKLNEYEFSIVQAHARVGYEILTMVSFPWPVAQIVLQHHEKLDGSGYSQGLHEADILQEAKILLVADVVEAMASHRPYRPALGIEKALEEITKNKGVLYDPESVEACVRLFTEKGYQFD
jgi:PAS domain S-box-containing protein/putative nucleotidyltransferase with HDIG domain